MMNFLLGTVAGGIIACVVTITAARHPEVQSRLGLIAPAHAALVPTPMAHAEPKCPSPAKAEGVQARVGHPDMLFEKKRFWFVSPIEPAGKR